MDSILPEIELFYAKVPDIIIGLLLGVLIMVLHRKADHKVHKLIEEVHDYTLSQNTLINRIAEITEKEQKIDTHVEQMIAKQGKLIEIIAQITEKEQKIDTHVEQMIAKQGKLIEMLYHKHQR